MRQIGSFGRAPSVEMSLRLQSLGAAALAVTLIAAASSPATAKSGNAAAASSVGDAAQQAAAASSGATTFSLSVSPSAYTTGSTQNAPGDFNNNATAATLSHDFGNGFSLGGLMQWEYNGQGASQYYGEADIAYTFNIGILSLQPQLGLGVTWDATGLGDNGNSSALYYALYLNSSVPLTSRLTWNWLQFEWRNAFAYRWITPSLGTGVSYQLDAADTLFGGFSYSWTDTGQPSDADNAGVTFGIARSF